MSRLDDKAIDAMNAWADHIEDYPEDFSMVLHGRLDVLSSTGVERASYLLETLGKVAKAERKKARRMREAGGV